MYQQFKSLLSPAFDEYKGPVKQILLIKYQQNTGKYFNLNLNQFKMVLFSCPRFEIPAHNVDWQDVAPSVRSK